MTKAEDLKLVWGEPDVEGLVQFLCREKGFNEERVRSSVAKMQKNKSGTVQNRLTSYFGAPQKKVVPEKEQKGKRDEKKSKEKKGDAKKPKRFTGK